jgi:hypothetical protein
VVELKDLAAASSDQGIRDLALEWETANVEAQATPEDDAATVASIYIRKVDTYCR